MYVLFYPEFHTLAETTPQRFHHTYHIDLHL